MYEVFFNLSACRNQKLLPDAFTPEEMTKFGADVPLKRAGEPAEVASCYV